MSLELLRQYIETGIIQFGRFQQPDGGYAPLAFYFPLLPSFPDLLRETVAQLQPYFQPDSPRERLLTMPDMTPVGGVIAVQTGMGMLYSVGDSRSYTGAFAIEGAADVGNPIHLLTGVLTDGKPESVVAAQSARVGLPVQHAVAIIRAGRSGSMLLQEEQGITAFDYLIDLNQHLLDLQAEGIIRPKQLETLQAFLSM